MALETAQPLPLMLPHVDVQPMGLIIPDTISEEQFREVGSRLASGVRSINWMIGDWLAFADGESSKRANRIYIDDSAVYKLAEEVSGLSYQTLRILKLVCSRICLFRRRNKLLFTHHSEIAQAFEDPAVQDDWLDRAEKEEWSVSELRVAIRQARKTEEDAEKEDDDDGMEKSQLFRDCDSFSSLLKRADIAKLPRKTQEALLKRLEPIAKAYDQLCELCPEPA